MAPRRRATPAPAGSGSVRSSVTCTRQDCHDRVLGANEIRARGTLHEVSIVTVPIIDMETVTPRSRVVTIRMPPEGLEFLPGQAVVVGTRGQHDRRPYSIACSPERAAETGRLELLVAVDASGSPGAHLASASPGTLVDLEGPTGAFTLPTVNPDHRVLCVAGGTGIAPLRSMLDHLFRRDAAPPVSLLYSARRRDEFAFIDELRAHTTAGRLEMHQTVTRDSHALWSGWRGRIGRSHFQSVLHEPAVTFCLVCGPEPMVKESVSTLKTLGVPDGQIRTERWAR
jgi:NAD(P)H-flavin reductase